MKSHERRYKMYKIIKRNGSVVAFDLSKISNAIEKAFIATQKIYQPQVIEHLTLAAIADAEKKVTDDMLHVEAIQDSVEKILSVCGYHDVSKAYILYPGLKKTIRIL